MVGHITAVPLWTPCIHPQRNLEPSVITLCINMHPRQKSGLASWLGGKRGKARQREITTRTDWFWLWRQPFWLSGQARVIDNEAKIVISPDTNDQAMPAVCDSSNLFLALFMEITFNLAGWSGSVASTALYRDELEWWHRNVRFPDQT